MPLTGQAKIDYQREYMRKRRSNDKAVTVRPVTVCPVRPKEPVIKSKPEGLSDNQWAYIQFKREQTAV